MAVSVLSLINWYRKRKRKRKKRMIIIIGETRNRKDPRTIHYHYFHFFILCLFFWSKWSEKKDIINEWIRGEEGEGEERRGEGCIGELYEFISSKVRGLRSVFKMHKTMSFYIF